MGWKINPLCTTDFSYGFRLKYPSDLAQASSLRPNEVLLLVTSPKAQTDIFSGTNVVVNVGENKP